MLHDLELGVLTVCDDILGIHLPIGDELGDGVHYLRVWPYGVGGSHVDIGQGNAQGHCLAAGEQLLPFVDVGDRLGSQGPLLALRAATIWPKPTGSTSFTSWPWPVMRA